MVFDMRCHGKLCTGQKQELMIAATASGNLDRLQNVSVDEFNPGGA